MLLEQAYLGDEVAIDIWVQLFEQVAGVLRPIATQVFLLQEEVHAQIGFADDGGILYGEVADAW